MEMTRSFALSHATPLYYARVVKIVLFKNAPGQTPSSHIAKLSAEAKGQERRYSVRMSVTNLSFTIGKSVSSYVLLFQYRMQVSFLSIHQKERLEVGV